MFKDPTKKDLQEPGRVNHLLLELTQLGKYECFGEDYNTISNSMLTPSQISKRAVPYTSVSKLPVECFSIKKQEFYEYIDDKTFKQFLIYLRRYPSDQELRSFFYEQKSWNYFKDSYSTKNIKIPVVIASDPRVMQQLEIEEAVSKEQRSKIILPKLNKKEQNTQRIMGFGQQNTGDAELKKIRDFVQSQVAPVLLGEKPAPEDKDQL